MAAEQHNLLRPLPAQDLAHDVRRRGIRLEVSFEGQAYPHTLATRHHADDAVGILTRDGRRGNRCHVLRILHGTRVRRAEAHRSNGPHERADGALNRSGTRAPGPVGHRFAVRHEGSVEEHDPPARIGCVPAEVVEAGHHEDFPFDARSRRRYGVTQAQHRQRVPLGRRDLGGLMSTDPVGHHHGLGPHAVEAVTLHRVSSPCDRTRQVVRSAQPRAEGVRQLCQPLPGGVITSSRRDQRGSRSPIGREPRRRRSGLRGRRHRVEQ